MRSDTRSPIKNITQSLNLYKKSLDWDRMLQQLNTLTQSIQRPDFWQDAQQAQKIMRERARIKGKISKYNSVSKDVQDVIELLEIAEMQQQEEDIKTLEMSIKTLQKIVDDMHLEVLLRGEADENDCFLEIHAGAGGTESCDWVVMLLRMYQRWSESRNFAYEVVECTDGEEVGLKSVTMMIKGAFAYGWLKKESGIHRLVRISPFDSSRRRHTSFSSVSIYPKIEDNIDVQILEKDLKVDTYRARGAGGQHVNTTDSAVRITHVPTKVVVQCQSQRSQHKNRSQALRILKAKLYTLELQKREDKASQQYREKTDIGWGHQIRSYVLHPYQMVKDLRTGVEIGDARRVLNGDIDCYLEANMTLLKSH